MNIGKLYQVKKYFWFLYPSKEIAAAAARTVEHVAPEAAAISTAPAHTAAYYRKHFKCNVSFIEPNSVFCLLEQDAKYCKVLSTNGEIGWIILADWYKDDIKEVKV
jgi:hypothetical protein